jgi:hypothetical protein
LTGRLSQTLAFVVLAALAAPASGYAAPVLRAADIRILIDADNSCRVTMRLTVEDAGALDHRIEAREDTRIHLAAVRGARQVQELRAIGRTQSLVLEPVGAGHEVAYSVERSASDDRCPLWVPVSPADGRSRAVHINVELPPGVTSRGTMPAFTWNGSTGSTTLAHVPAFVRVAYGPAGDAMTWEVSTAMDALAVFAFAGASGIWLWRRRR